jgi:transposase-like protein
MEWEKLRLIAANMFEQGLSTQVIATTLKVDDQTVRRWRRAFNASGPRRVAGTQTCRATASDGCSAEAEVE